MSWPTDMKAIVKRLEEEGGENAKLERARLAGVRLKEVTLSDATLRGADLAGARVVECGLDGVTLDEADLTEATFKDSDLSGASFTKAKLTGASFASSSAEDCDFTDADARGMRAKDTDLAGATFLRTNLSSAHFQDLSLAGAKLRDADLRNSKLTDVNLEDAELVGCDLRGADLSKVTLDQIEGATIRDVVEDASTKWPKGFVRDRKRPATSSDPKPAKPAQPPKKDADARGRLVGEVSTFGDPILVCDVDAAGSWHGAGDDGASKDYTALCEEVNDAGDAAIIAIDGTHRVAAWDMEGEGTAYVFRTGEAEILIVRPWMDDDEVDDEASAASALSKVAAKKPRTIGTLSLGSGGLLLLASARDANAVLGGKRPAVPSQLREDGDDDGDGIGVLVDLPPGEYELAHDTVEAKAGSARRCRIAKR